MKTCFIALIILIAAGAAIVSADASQDDPACAVAAPLVYADYPLARAGKALNKGQKLEIAVIGTGSSRLPGPSGTDLGYPARLQPALAKRLSDVANKVTSYAKSSRNTAEMAKDIEKLLQESKPTLVVWQTGTVDAMKGVDPDDFKASLETGIDALRRAGVDVILMNMQYSPRTETMIALNAYADTMRAVSQQQEVPLFDRFAVMKQWNELGTFDLLAATKSIDTATRVHDCIAQLLADLIVEGVKMGAQPKAVQ